MATPYANPFTVAQSESSLRALFIRNTYCHLALAILAFIGLEAYLVNAAWAEGLVHKMVGGMSWLVVLGAFMVVSWIADRWARSDASPGMQYLGLGLFVVAEALIFLPILFIAVNHYSPDVLGKAGLVTGGLFLGLTATAFITKKDFSFLRTFLVVGGFVALAIIVVSILFGFNMGTIFAGGMAIFASVSILYTTSNIIHHYRPDQHVAASLALFSGVALLFWYILQIFMSNRD